MTIQSILALTDFSASGNHALERAAWLAAEHRAALTIMYTALGDKPDCADAAQRLVYQARQLAAQFGLAVGTVDATHHSAERLAIDARRADLLVLGHAYQRSWMSFLSGQPALQLMRLCHCPVLVTKNESNKPYGRTLVAVDFTPASRRLVELACLLDGKAEVELFHAVSARDEAKLRSAEASTQAVKAYRQACISYAQGRILSLTDSFDTRRNRVLSTIGHGDPARQLLTQQQHTGADLLVVGKQRRSTLMDFFFGSVAQRVLRWSAADLLVVPHDFQLATSAMAPRGTDVEAGHHQPAWLASRRRAF
ncbi:universal stress protein [Polaromonas sp. UC242_47]|uniref:universal stress protein n=1 Tax=Polaromonas sp. UC242_47 TaxID=3374626 RepID=UPI0037BBD3E9